MNDNDILDEEKEKTISLADIISWILRGKLPALITAAVLLVLSLIALVFILNPSKQIYEVEFDYSSVPGLSDGTYIDGTKFNYQDIIIEKNVNVIIENNKKAYQAKETNYDYSTINFTKLFESNKFTIDVKRIYWDNQNSTSDTEPELKATHYVIQMPPKAFKSQDLAKAFAKDLIEYPLIKTQEMVDAMDFTVNLNMYNSVSSFESKLSYLQSQVDLLKDGFASFNGTTAGTQYTIDGVTYNFTSIIASIDDYLNTQNYDIMDSELSQKGYVNDKETARAKYDVQKQKLIDEHNYLETQKTAVDATYLELSNAIKDQDKNLSSDQILSLLTKINDTLVNQRTNLDLQIAANEEEQRKLDIKINALDNISDDENKAFKTRLDNIYNRLSEETTKYDKIYKNITTRNMYVYYLNSNIIATTGSMNSLIVYGAPIIIALIAFVAVGWIYGYVKTKKEESQIPVVTE